MSDDVTPPGGGDGAVDAGDILEPRLARGELRLAGATTRREYRGIEKDPALERLARGEVMLEVTDAATALLAQLGYEPEYGARPLRRVIQREVDDRIAELFVAGELVDGDAVTVDAIHGGIVVLPGTAFARAARGRDRRSVPPSAPGAGDALPHGIPRAVLV